MFAYDFVIQYSAFFGTCPQTNVCQKKLIRFIFFLFYLTIVTIVIVKSNFTLVSTKNTFPYKSSINKFFLLKLPTVFKMHKWLIKKTKNLNGTSRAERHGREDTLFEALKAEIQRQNNKRKANWTHKYCDEYLCFGFIAGGSQNSESMKPSKLNRHLNTLHSEYSDKRNNFFIDKKNELIAARTRNEKWTHFSSVKRKPYFDIFWLIA